MTPIRAQGIYGTGALIDTVWKGIQEAEIVIADITGQNPNVLYELGLAHVIGKRVVLLAQQGENIPADIAYTRQVRYNLDVYDVLDFMNEFKENVRAARDETPKEKSLQLYQLNPVDAKVVAVMTTFVIVETIDGRKGILNAEDISWSSLSPNLSRIRIGEKLNGAFITSGGVTKYSLIALQENPWPSLESEFPPGKGFIEEVENCNPRIGIFVRMKYGINGLIPAGKIPMGAILNIGDKVEVQTKWIDRSLRRVELKFIRKTESRKEELWEPPYPVGEKLEGIVAHLDLQKKYILVKLPRCTAILHASHMSSEFRTRFEKGDIQKNSSVAVKVVEIDRRRKGLKLCNTE
jgi:ribosomal protein S1